MKVELEKISLGHSEMTDEVYAGVKNKNETRWLEKKNVTNDFIACVLSRWEGKSETITSGDSEWEITVKKIK